MMALRLGPLGKILLVVAVLIVALVAVIGWLIWRRPLTVDANVSRWALTRAGLTETVVQAPSGPMTVLEGGSGDETLVLLHGVGDQAGAWARIVPSLVGHYRLVIPDLPGHWRSPPLEGPLHIRVVLEGVEALVAAEAEAHPGERPPILVGNSMGAWVAMLYAVDHPDAVSRIVAVNGGPLIEPNPQVNLFPTTREEARATMAGLMGPATPPPPDFVLDDIVRRTRTSAAARLAQTAAELGSWVLDGRLDQVTVPVDLVWGESDQLMTMGYAQRMLAGLERARLYPVKACGHVPQRECPLRFVEALEKALGEPYGEPAELVTGEQGDGPSEEAAEAAP